MADGRGASELKQTYNRSRTASNIQVACEGKTAREVGTSKKGW